MKKPIPPRALRVPDHAKKVFTGEIYDTYQWPQEMFDGTTATFEMLKRTDTVVVIAASNDEQIVVLEESQPHSGSYTTLPSGRVEENEDILVAAQRELVEETGMTYRTWKLVGVEQPHPKIEHFVYIFTASELLTESTQNLDGGEKITVRKMPFREYVDMVIAGSVPLDVFTLRQIANNPELKLSDILSLSEI